MVKHQSDWRKFYWIDFVKLFSQFLNDDEELGMIHYFTARPKNIGKTARQNILMGCNKALNPDKIKFHYGKYQDKSIKCRATDGCGRDFMHWEEKQTDVSLAIKIVEDCHRDDCNKIVLVSGDSDFLPPLKLVKNFYSTKELMVLFPPFKYTNSIAGLGITCLSLDKYKSRWNKSRLDEVVTIDSKDYRIPTEWIR